MNDSPGTEKPVDTKPEAKPEAVCASCGQPDAIHRKVVTGKDTSTLICPTSNLH